MLKGKKILLGITGSIAAYKAVFLVRLLITAGAEIKVIMTPAAKEFASPLTLATLSKNNVLSDFSTDNSWANHVLLGRWADIMLIAPLSCNSLSKMVNGLCDNLLIATYLSATCPVAIAPAMDEDMWHHYSTKKNIEVIKQSGQFVIPVVKGELASGLYGEGRMAEPEDIITFLEENFFRSSVLKGKTALVTAGPTYEAIDPVRFLGNYSSGKMGTAVAEQLYTLGAMVHLVCGPGSQMPQYKNITITHVTSAHEMYNTCMSLFVNCDIAVMAAAVADYTPKTVSSNKIKKNNAQLNLELIKTRDILQNLGEIKNDKQILVGFALETDNENENAQKKLIDKNADFIVLNSLKDEAAGFGKDTNKVTIFDRSNNRYSFEAKSKKSVAADIADVIIKKINEEN